jgi:predicted Rossmann fold flavoprotein
LFHDILIIGGGASGLIAAITSKDMGKDVALIEGSDRIGKKLLSTGNGRCNITNTDLSFSRYHSENPSFPHSILNNFGYNETESFFSLIGLPLTTLEEGKVFPLSLQASSVLDIFRFSLEERSIPVYLNSKVKKITPQKNGFSITTSGEETFECSKLILCCGGKSFPASGSDGSGFSLAKHLGHNIIRLVPALVQLKLKCENLKAVSGVKFNGYAKLAIDGMESKTEYGEILFTDYGISGPPVLQLSRNASKALSEGREPYIQLDVLPEIEAVDLENFLENHWGTFSYRSVYNSFIGIIHKKLIPIILKESSIKNIHKPCFELTLKEKEKLFEIMKSWKFKIYDTNSFTNSQVTAGGVDTREIWPSTLESKIIPELYFAGEIIDVDGDCGGFNLQWAWSSGYTAAKNASDGKHPWG